ncbi:CLUMA_CG011764, isoform B [Clunio marinus]|uniref:limulus clotting factor C n=1 Tax=Clunio marinus TaxID=568069 RepID=A0A1J1IDQ2_9DIPT|nr:CLUMA_CG011764, isoform B [Clunio marinus]
MDFWISVSSIINDVDLSNQQEQISNNITRLKDSIFDDLDEIELRNSVKEARRVLNENKASAYKKTVLFSPWSSWSDCDKKCKQKRSRKCTSRRKCGSLKQIEERSCSEKICQKTESSQQIAKESKKNRNKHTGKDSNKEQKRVNNQKKKKKKFEDDPYNGDDEFEDDENDNGIKPRSVIDGSRLVMKVVKQGDYQHKQTFDRRSGGLGDIEQEFFLPRNLTLFDIYTPNSTSPLMLKNGSKSNKRFESDDDDFYDDYDTDHNTESDEKIKTVDRAKVKAVFEMPRKPLANYSKWSRWSKCSSKCVTKRYKKCRPHARHICGSEIIREIAYCYTEGSFCEEWISSQISKIGAYNAVEATNKPIAKPTKPNHRTESPLANAVSQNFYSSPSGSGRRRKYKLKPEYKPQNLQCGFPSIRNKNNDFALKIIGGKSSRRAQWPWQVAILNRYKEAFCGGTLISPNWILTASHCVRKRLYVILGEHNLNVRDGSEIEFRIQTAIKHPKYNKKTVDSDIALLKLPQSIERSHYIGYACLPENTVIGWGKRRHSDESGTSILHEAEVPIISNEACKNVYYDYVITKNMFCAGANRVDTCAGDSGGPILCRDSKKSNKPWTVYGITSFGDGCGKKNKFGIYTKLTNYVDFIWSIINCNGLCENNNKNTY